MTRLLTICLAFWELGTVRNLEPSISAIFDIGQSVSTKLEFDEEKESSGQVSHSSKEDEDVEVKHTIVVSTKLKSNNRRGLQSDGGNIAQTFSIGHASNAKTEESSEVPIIKGYKSVESTVIRTPDTRDKPPTFSNPVYITRNRPYDYNPYPVASNPTQWQPSSFFNNVNWWKDESSGGFNDYNRRNWQFNRNQPKFHRKITDDGVKEFYCRKCRELSNGPENKGCVQQRSNSWVYENTTPKVKIDGKLLKLN